MTRLSSTDKIQMEPYKDFYESWEEVYDRAIMQWHDQIIEAWKKITPGLAL